jgi:carbohydrate-selective porin OprB
MPGGALPLGRPRPASRVELTVGKFATTDFFDVADASTDPRHRFLNWSLMTNGAWDFAADTRGYTWGLVVAVETPRWALRAGEAMMPTTPNGPVLDRDLAHARSEMVEAELRHRLGGGGAVKLLAFQNHARMGAFADALAAAPPGRPPDVGAVERVGAAKRGVGLLAVQRIGPASAFVRASWNDGHTEEYAFTQIERAASAGAELATDGWGRAGDHLGLGVAVNALGPAHARYLQAGGVEFQLGDGTLRYRPEVVSEAYYALHAGRSIEVTADVQGIVNPGMNADRGPALAFGLRLHAHI